jgi:hypothetical protein
MCRTCDVSTANVAWPDLVCNVHVADIVHALNTLSTTELNAIRQCPGFNCLYSIDCGGDSYGVFSMIHTEGLHALEVGIMDYSLKILLDLLSSKQKSILDGLVKRLINQPRQHGYGPFPRLLWPDSVTTSVVAM